MGWGETHEQLTTPLRSENRVCLQCTWTCCSLGSHLLASVSQICQSMAAPILTITTYSITEITYLMANKWPSTIGNVV